MPVSKNKKRGNKMHSFGERKAHQRKEEAEARLAKRYANRRDNDYDYGAVVAEMLALTSIVHMKAKRRQQNIAKEANNEKD